ncbi:ankyrin repeat domain-containing protein [Candidatus Dependentiae bacterium]
MKKIVTFKLLASVLTSILFFNLSYSMRRGYYKQKKLIRHRKKGGRRLSKRSKKDLRNIPLHDAVLEGNIEKINKHGSDILKVNKYGRTALHMALFSRCYYKERDRIVEILLKQLESYLEKSCVFNISKYQKEKNKFLNKEITFYKSKSKDTALNIAISKGYFGIAKILINAGADVAKCSDDSGKSSLHRALLFNLKKTKWNTEKDLEILIDKILKKLNKKKRLEVVNAFVVSRAGKSMDTALNIAISKGYFGIAKMFIDTGADLTKCGDDSGLMSLHRALLFNLKKNKEKSEKDLELLVDKILKKLNKKKRVEVINAFVVITARKGKSRSTALNIAISKGYFGVANMLVAAGADVTKYDESDGMMSLHFALLSNLKKSKEKSEKDLKSLIDKILKKLNKKKCLEVINALVSTSRSSKNKDTALNIAISKGYFDIAKMLIDVGADVTKHDDYGRMSLHKAIVCGNVKVFYYLVNYYHKKSLNPNAQDKLKKRTFLLWLARMVKGSAKKKYNKDAVRLKIEDAKGMIKVLLEKLGALLTIRDCDGFNMLHWLVMKNRFALLETVLRSSSAKNKILEAFMQPSKKSFNDKLSNTFYSEGQTPIDMIQTSQINKDFIQLLKKIKSKTAVILLDKLKNPII